MDASGRTFCYKIFRNFRNFLLVICNQKKDVEQRIHRNNLSLLQLQPSGSKNQLKTTPRYFMKMLCDALLQEIVSTDALSLFQRNSFFL